MFDPSQYPRRYAARANTAFGADPDRRLDAYRVWQRRLAFAALLSGLVVFWAWIFPYPYPFVLGYLIVVPVAAVVAAAIWRRKLTLMLDDRAACLFPGGWPWLARVHGRKPASAA